MRRLFILIIVILCFDPTDALQSSQTVFYYQINSDDTNTSEICWFLVDFPNEETCFDVPSFSKYAISPNGHFASIRSTSDGQILLVDIVSRDVMPFNLCQPTQEFLWDAYYAKSGTMLWSPSGRYLTFTGVATDTACTVMDNANVYVYDVQTETLTNITEDSSPIRSLAIPSSWSPDEEWIAIKGAWSEQENDQGASVPAWGSAIIASNGETFFDFAPNYNTCRLTWSPDMRWLASTTDCFESSGTGSALMLMPFDPNPVTVDGRRIDEVISPIYFDWRPNTYWSSSYREPMWLDESTLFAYRSILPISFGYLDEQQTDAFSVNGLVSINVDTLSEVLLPYTEFEDYASLIDNWYVAQNREFNEYTAFNPVLDEQFIIPTTVNLCPLTYALNIDVYGDYIAVINACVSTNENPSFDVYRTDDFTLIWQRVNTEEVYLHLMGFHPLPASN